VRDAADVGDERALHIDAGARAEGPPVARAEAIRGKSGRQHVDGSGDAVVGQHRAHGLGRGDEGLHGRALRAREAARQEARERRRHERHVVMQVLLEERVIGRDAGDSRAPREAYPGVVGDERRLNVHQIEATGAQRIERAPERAPAHAPVFGIARHRRRRHPQHPSFIARPPGALTHRRGAPGRRIVARRHEAGLHAEARQVLAESADRGRDAVDAREIDVGDEEHAH
jgi:hypothetical protein